MAKKKIDFRVNGRPLRFSNREKAVRFLDSLPFGELVTTQELSIKTGISPRDASLLHPDLLIRSAKHNNLRVWSNAKTVQELNRQIGQQRTHA